jgi:hypothetical protein
MKHLTRRAFLEDSLLAVAATAASALPMSLAAAESRPRSANDRITVGIIGCGIRGKQHASALAKLAECDIACVCDPDSTRAEEVAAQLVAANRPRPKTVRICARCSTTKRSTPYLSRRRITACARRHLGDAGGQGRYVEKPVSHNIVEDAAWWTRHGSSAGFARAARSTARVDRTSTPSPTCAKANWRRETRAQHRVRHPRFNRRRRVVSRSPARRLQPVLRSGVDGTVAPPEAALRLALVLGTGNGELGNNNIHSLDVLRWGLGVSGLGRSVISFGGRSVTRTPRRRPTPGLRFRLRRQDDRF